MEMISFSRNGATPFQQLLGHNEGILKRWVDLEESIFESGTFSAELKEEVRRTLAFHNGCEYCKAKGVPSENAADRRTQMAIRAADISAEETHISEDALGALKEVFTDGEISELFALICFITASQRFGALMNLGPVCRL